jgi:hypothetical protein
MTAVGRNPKKKRTTSQRGYGSAHAAVRARVASQVASATARCTRCGAAIGKHDAWDLDHRDDRRGWLGPAHASCNRSAGALKNRRKPEQEPLGWSRAWYNRAPLNRSVILDGVIYAPGERITR